MASSLFLFHIGFSLPSYGQGGGMVIAPNVVDAMNEAVRILPDGWMLSDPNVKVYRMEKAFLAVCNHECGTYDRDDVNVWSCDDCNEVFRCGSDSEATATRFGFEVYCENLRNARQYPFNPAID